MRNILLSTAIFFAIAPVFGDGLTGEFLSINHAVATSDNNALSGYVEKALQSAPNDPRLLKRAMISAVLSRDFLKAESYLAQLKAQRLESEVANFFEMSIALGKGDMATSAVLARKFDYIHPVIFEAISMASNGDVPAALKHLSDAGNTEANLKPLFQYESANIVAHYNKDYTLADQYLQGEAGPIYLNDFSFFNAIAIKILKGDSAKAVEMVRESYGEPHFWPANLSQIIKEAEVGNVEKSLTFATPQNIAAEYLSTIFNNTPEGAIDFDTESMSTTLIANIAPQADIYALAVLSNFYKKGEYESVIEAAKMIPDTSTLKVDRDRLKFSALMAIDHKDEAKALLDALNVESVDAQLLRADGEMALEDFASAFPHYEALMKQVGISEALRADVTFQAAICAERLGQLKSADVHFDSAIKLSPNNADLLNYYGYSLVDRAKGKADSKVDEGLKLIERAVKIDSTKAHILDSLGWAYFKVGRYQDALPPLELAVSQMSFDPIVNGHLGDVYWKLGRNREAGFQWQRALKHLEEDLPDMKRADLESRLQDGLPD